MTYSFRDITVRAGKAIVVRGASSTLEPGKVAALIGHNGAGKTSLLTALAGLRACSGGLLLDGRPLTATERRSSVAYMPQDIGAQSSLTALEVILLGRLDSLGFKIPKELIAEAAAALDRFGLSGLQSRNLSAVSGGQRQLIYLTQALFRNPSLLLLDEPTASLDLRHQLIVMEAVRDYAGSHSVAVVVAMHDISLAAQFADQIICMRDGTIEASGAAQEVLQPDRLRALFGVEVEISVTRSGHLHVVPVRAV